MANVYTCTNATGNIDGLSSISGNCVIKYTVTSISSGSVEGKTVNGSYSKSSDDGCFLELSNFSGVCTVDSVYFSDTVDRTQCTFKVITKLTTEEEDTDEYEKWLICNPDITVLTDDNGALLVDGNGNYLIEG